MPDLGCNLFSPVAAFDGVTYDKFGGPEKFMTAFGGDVVFRLVSGSLLSSTALRIPPSAAPEALSAVAHCKEKYVDVNDFHRIHAHANLMLLRATAKRLNVELSGELLPCCPVLVLKWEMPYVEASLPARRLALKRDLGVCLWIGRVQGEWCL